MNEPFEPEQSVEPKKEKWSRGRIAIGCGVALIIVVCACAILGAAGVGLLTYWRVSRKLCKPEIKLI